MRKLYTIEEIKELTVPIAKQYGVDKLALFGSYANNTATKYSDVDFLIKKGKITGLWEYAGFIMKLEEQLKLHVDMMTYEALKESALANVLGGEVVLYEQ